MSKHTKPTKSSERVALVAGIKTQGAAPGATASPLRKDLDAWIALGWLVVEPESETPDIDHNIDQQEADDK